MITPAPSPGRTLDVFEVVEEEYGRLHPDEAPVENRQSFDAGQIADPASLARVFCDALRFGVNEWERSPARSAALFALEGQPALRESAEAFHQLASAGAGPAASADARAAFVGHVVVRLNALVDGPLLGGRAFDALYREAGISAADAAPDERCRRANRRLLEAAFAPAVARLRDVRLAAVYDKIRRMGHSAVCLSGGGIRSATFALGVLTGLARHRLLGRFDYLSTVSGGGYIGSWLSAWMKYEGASRVEEQLGSMTGEKLQPDPEPVSHLRSYAAYLTPRLGALSADTWTLVATMLRNLLLNWVVLVPLMLAVLLEPRLAVSALRASVANTSSLWAQGPPVSEVVDWIVYAIGFALGLMAISYVHRNRPRETRTPPPVAERTQQAFIWRCLVPLILAASAMTFAWWDPEMMRAADGGGEPRHLIVEVTTLGWFAAAGLAMHVMGWYLGLRQLRRRGREVAVVAATGALAGLMSAELVHMVELVASNQYLMRAVGAVRADGFIAPRLYVTLAVPAFLTLIMVGSQLFIGLTSWYANDQEREWSARFNAWIFIVIVTWVGFHLIVLILPPILEHAWRGRNTILLGTGGVSGLITLLLGRSASTPATDAPSGSTGRGGWKATLAGIGLALAAPVFAVCLISLLSVLNGQVVLSGACAVSGWCGSAYYDGLRNLEVVQLHPSDFTPPLIIALAMIVLAAVGLGLGRLIDTNQFSLHAMYRNRLARAFLRASRPRDMQAPDPFTGFDRADDLPMGTLWPSAASAASSRPDPDDRRPPLHVVNTTLNVVSGRSLAWQQRQAAPLSMTALHAGSAYVGYRRVSEPAEAPPSDAPKLYGGPQGISLGSAVTISGAAASPEMGYHSSPVVTFLMALFNARLGSWLGNPGAPGDRSFQRSAPPIGVFPLLREMFGLTTDSSDFVFLSDGGHFENLALYEMVLRRCRFILVSDGGADPTATFEDLGNAIRKIRIDMGVPIDFPDGIHIYSRDVTINTTPGTSPVTDGTYWAVGRIRYSQIDRAVGDERPDEEFDGVLLYVKPALYGTEPPDVDNYAKMSPTFPHESTADQFFTESQFESYRALGAYIVDQMVGRMEATAQQDGGDPATNPLAWLRPRGIPA